MPVSFLGKMDHFEKNWFSVFCLSPLGTCHHSFLPSTINTVCETDQTTTLCFSLFFSIGTFMWMNGFRKVNREHWLYTSLSEGPEGGGVLCHLFRANSWVARNLSKTAGRGGRSIVGLSIILCHWLTLQSCLRADCSPQTSKTAECDSAVLLNAVQWY